MGQMVESVKRSGAFPEFSTLTRDDRKHVYINEAACVSQPRSFDGPAPSDYELPSSLMKQAESTKRSAPTAKFTTLTRPKMRCLHAESGGRAHVTALGRNPSTNCTLTRRVRPTGAPCTDRRAALANHAHSCVLLHHCGAR